jgi:uncharacterized protein YutD
MEIIINENKYNLDRNIKEAFNLDELKTKMTDYFDSFDYVLGDYAYGKLRLKGFNDKDNKNFKSYNDINGLDEYIKNNCAYGCRYFLISKVKDLK